MALFDFPQYIYNNCWEDPDLVWLARHAKLDQVLHAQNIADCAVKDQHNQYSIDGLLEIMTAEGIGSPAALVTMMNDARYHELVNTVDKAVYDVAQTHKAIKERYRTRNMVLGDPAIVAIDGIKARPYF